MRKLWKIHIGLIISFFISFFSTMFLVIFSNEEINAYYPIALLLTYMYLIINFLKDDFNAQEIDNLYKYYCKVFYIYKKHIPCKLKL